MQLRWRQPQHLQVPTSIAIADVNGDGKLDAIVADNASSGRVVILPQDPANPGHFLAPVPLATPSAASGVAVGDINGDGRPDIAVADGNTATVMHRPRPRSVCQRHSGSMSLSYAGRT